MHIIFNNLKQKVVIESKKLNTKEPKQPTQI